MNVGVISDRHNPNVGVQPPPDAAVAFQGVDVTRYVLHNYVPSCLDWLETVAPVCAVELGHPIYLVELIDRPGEQTRC